MTCDDTAREFEVSTREELLETIKDLRAAYSKAEEIMRRQDALTDELIAEVESLTVRVSGPYAVAHLYQPN